MKQRVQFRSNMIDYGTRMELMVEVDGERCGIDLPGVLLPDGSTSTPMTPRMCADALRNLASWIEEKDK